MLRQGGHRIIYTTYDEASMEKVLTELKREKFVDIATREAKYKIKVKKTTQKPPRSTRTGPMDKFVNFVYVE